MKIEKLGEVGLCVTTGCFIKPRKMIINSKQLTPTNF